MEYTIRWRDPKYTLDKPDECPYCHKRVPNFLEKGGFEHGWGEPKKAYYDFVGVIRCYKCDKTLVIAECKDRVGRNDEWEKTGREEKKKGE